MSKFVGSGTDLGYGHAHCGSCFMVGHQLAHPDLSCEQVGCPGGHPAAPWVAQLWTQPCSDAEHGRCAGYVASPERLCTCRCHDEVPLFPWTADGLRGLWAQHRSRLVADRP